MKKITGGDEVSQTILETDEKKLENNMNQTGYKTYCTIIKNNYGTYDIMMTSGSFKDSMSSEAVDNYIGAAVASTGLLTSKSEWKARMLIIKVGLGKKYEISTLDCRKCVELFNHDLPQKASDYLFSKLKTIEQ